MSEILEVKYNGEKSYDIWIESSFNHFKEAFSAIGKSYPKVCLVADSNISKIYNNLFFNLFPEESKIVTFVFPAGEESKNLLTVQKLYGFLIENNFNRNDLLVAFGGGVTGDLVGFCAATYLRGIDFVQIPTSLLSQVDSSVGGKTGVDFDSYKNMIGAFYMPKLVYCNTELFKSLPDRQFNSGMAEVIKYSLIFDSNFIDYLDENKKSIKALDNDSLKKIVKISLEHKRRVVEEDPTEKNIRALLNFGHTIGHAVEKLKDFQLFHGECVAIGMVAALYLSQRKRLIDDNTVKRAVDLIKDYNLPVSVSGLSAEQVLSTTYSDKKRIEKGIKFILLKDLGEGFIDYSVTDQDILSVCDKIIEK